MNDVSAMSVAAVCKRPSPCRSAVIDRHYNKFKHEHVARPFSLYANPHFCHSIHDHSTGRDRPRPRRGESALEQAKTAQVILRFLKTTAAEGGDEPSSIAQTFRLDRPENRA